MGRYYLASRRLEEYREASLAEAQSLRAGHHYQATAFPSTTFVDTVSVTKQQ